MAEKKSTTPQDEAGTGPQSPLFTGAANPFFRLARVNAEAANLISRYDPITRLPNQVQFLEDFAQLKGGSKGAGRVLVLVTLGDAAQFNEISLTLGHRFVEAFVQSGAMLLQTLLPRHQPLYHVSALSFVLVAEASAQTDPPAIVGYIARAFTRPLLCMDVPLKARAGIGLLDLAGFSSDGADALRACLAAAQLSRQSPEGFALYDGRMEAAHQRALRILGELPGALAAPDQLSLHFQPRIEMHTGLCIGAEALLRWHHPELGTIAPAELIPLAEQTAFMAAVTDWVVSAALEQAQNWTKAGRAIEISLNISHVNLLEQDFEERLIDQCLSRGVNPQQLGLELPEAALIGNAERLTGRLLNLKQAGFKIAVDDFGSSQSNLSLLPALPVDMLKLDGSLIRPLAAPDADLFLLRQIIAMSKGLDFRVCAEGIESAAIYETLSELGCDEGQGYLMARPMPVPLFDQWFEQAN